VTSAPSYPRQAIAYGSTHYRIKRDTTAASGALYSVREAVAETPEGLARSIRPDWPE